LGGRASGMKATSSRTNEVEKQDGKYKTKPKIFTEYIAADYQKTTVST